MKIREAMNIDEAVANYRLARAAREVWDSTAAKAAFELQLADETLKYAQKKLLQWAEADAHGAEVLAAQADVLNKVSDEEKSDKTE